MISGPGRRSSGSKSCDTGYKLLFSHPELVRDLLEGFVHEKWVREIDFTTLKMVPPPEGKLESAREIIMRMHRLGIDPDFIASVVDMPVEKVKEIIASHSG